MKLTPALCREIRQYTFAVIRAREEYAAYPIVAIEEDWCEACDWPRRRRNCSVCRAHLVMRTKRARKKA